MKMVFKSPKAVAAIVIALLYFFPVFPYAIGYSGFRFTHAASSDAFLYAILYFIPLICIYVLLPFFIQEERYHFFFSFQKYSGKILTALFGFTFLLMLANGSFRSLSGGYWISLLCGLIIIFDRRITQTAINLKTKPI